MRAKKFGRIVNIGSINGQAGQYGQVNYAAAKSGIHGFTKALAQEGARFGITCNAIAPGYVDTEMVRAVPPDVLQKIVARIPMGRLGHASDIARGVVFLTADDARLHHRLHALDQRRPAYVLAASGARPPPTNPARVPIPLTGEEWRSAGPGIRRPRPRSRRAADRRRPRSTPSHIVMPCTPGERIAERRPLHLVADRLQRALGRAGMRFEMSIASVVARKRGAITASCIVMPQSSTLSSACRIAIPIQAPPGAPSVNDRRALLEHDGGRHGREAPLAGRDRAGAAGARIVPVHRPVQHEAGARAGSRPEGVAERVRDRHHHARPRRRRRSSSCAARSRADPGQLASSRRARMRAAHCSA